MPPINDYRCNKCGLSFPSGWGGYMYVEVDKEFLRARYQEITTRLNELNKIIEKISRQKEELEKTSTKIAEETAKMFRERIERELRAAQESLRRLKLRIEETSEEMIKVVKDRVKRIIQALYPEQLESLTEIDLDLEHMMEYVVDSVNRTIKTFEPKFTEENIFDQIKSEIHHNLEKFLSKLDTVLRRRLIEEKQKLEEDKRYIEQLKEELNRTGKDYMRIKCPHPVEIDTVKLILGEASKKLFAVPNLLK